MEQKSKKHFWIKQLKRPICALIVVLIVVFYGISIDVFAWPSMDASDKTTIGDYFDLSQSVNVSWPVMRDAFTASGGDVTKIVGYNSDGSLGIMYSGSLNYRLFPSSFSNNNYNNNMLSVPLFYKNSQDTESFSNFHLILTFNAQYSVFITYQIEGEGNFCIERNRVVSDKPFKMMQNRSNQSSTYETKTISSVQTEGVYVGYFITNWPGTDSVFAFSDLPVFLPSIDGSTGYTEETFDFRDIGNYYNFNTFAEVPNVNPEPEPEFSASWQDAYHYLNFRMSSDYYGNSVDSIYHGMKFNWNENMINNPGYYILYASYSAVYQDDTMSSPVTFTGPDVSIPLIVLAYRGNNQGRLPGSYMIGCPLSSFKDSNDNTLKSYLLQTIHRKTGTSIQYINADNFFEWFLNGSAFYDETTDTSVPPLGYVVPEFESDILKFEITGTVRVGRQASITDSYISDYFSGSNVTHFDFINGDTSLSQSDNADNLYPIDSESTLPPSVISGNGGNVSTYGGSNNVFAQGGQGGTVIINEPFTPYKLDADVYGSMADIINFIKNDFLSASESGFYPVITQTASYIPAPIWHVIFTGISVITLCSVVAFVRNRR